MLLSSRNVAYIPKNVPGQNPCKYQTLSLDIRGPGLGGLFKGSWFTDLCSIVIMVPPPGQRGIGSFFRKESGLNDEEWDDQADRWHKRAEEALP